MLGDFNDPRVAAAVGQVFGDACTDMRGLGARSNARESDGELPVSETSMTDVLVDAFSSSVRDRLAAAQESLRITGVDLSVTFDVTKPPGETVHGADLGIRITIVSDRYVMTKACLVQCKRMYGPASSPTFNEIRGRGEAQALSMLKISPASFFMLYSFLPQEDLLALAGVPFSIMCPRRSVPTAVRHDGDLASCNVWKGVGSQWDLGISMLPATRVMAISAAAAKKHVPMPTGADVILAGAWPFATFMTDLLGSCTVGDPRSDVVKLVTPDSKWKAEGTCSPKTGPREVSDLDYQEIRTCRARADLRMSRSFAPFAKSKAGHHRLRSHAVSA